MRLIPHSEEWYEWLSRQQRGYFYPGRRVLPLWHGEDNFRELVFAHLTAETDVLEVACAQGDLALAMAPRCRSLVGYDATTGYIDLARAAAAQQGVTNARFVVHNSRGQYNGGKARVPVEDHSIDLWVNSKGPFHPIADAPRACRPGAVLLTLVADGGVPGGGSGPYPWNALLPEALRFPEIAGRGDPNWPYTTVSKNLAEAGLRIHSWWDIDVPVYTPDPYEYYVGLSWPFARDEVPPYAQVRPAFEQIFREYAGPQGLEQRWRRSIWKAVVPE
jgi:SAM-dependent methyltransferase